MPKLDELLTKLAAPDSGSREQAAWELGNLGPAAAPAAMALAQALGDDLLRGSAGWALVKIGGPALDALTQALADPREAVRLAAVSALWKIAPERPEAIIPALVGALQDGCASVRAYTAWSLGEIGRIAAPAAEALATVLANDSTPQVRERAAEAMGRIGEPSDGAVWSLTGALSDRQAEVRRAAVGALLELASTRRVLELRLALPALDHSARHGARAERGLYRSAAAAIRASAPTLPGASNSADATLPLPATAPDLDPTSLPRPVP